MFIFSNWKELLTLQRTHLGPVLHACADPASCLLCVSMGAADACNEYLVWENIFSIVSLALRAVHLVDIISLIFIKTKVPDKKTLSQTLLKVVGSPSLFPELFILRVDGRQKLWEIVAFVQISLRRVSGVTDLILYPDLTQSSTIEVWCSPVSLAAGDDDHIMWLE